MPFPTLDEIFNPTWSPDGAAIVLHGDARGLTDLFVYDLADAAAAPAHQRCVCRYATRVVARRPAHRVCDRSLLDAI